MVRAISDSPEFEVTTFARPVRRRGLFHGLYSPIGVDGSERLDLGNGTMRMPDGVIRSIVSEALPAASAVSALGAHRAARRCVRQACRPAGRHGFPRPDQPRGHRRRATALRVRGRSGMTDDLGISEPGTKDDMADWLSPWVASGRADRMAGDRGWEEHARACTPKAPFRPSRPDVASDWRSLRVWAPMERSAMAAHSALIGKAGEMMVAAELMRRGVEVACPSSDDLGQSAVFRSGGSGPSWVRG